MMLKQIFKGAARGLCILALIASVFIADALVLSAHAETTPVDPLYRINLSDEAFEFHYTPTANSDYALFVFAQSGAAVNAHAQLFENEQLLAEGTGSGELFSLWLVSGHSYTVRISGSGSAVIEMARRALSRCYADPLDIAEESEQGKMLARSGDAHWYAFTAREAGQLALTCMPEDNLTLSALLFDESGTLISAFDGLAGGGALLYTPTETGSRYYIRVWSPAGNIGYYVVHLRRGDGEAAVPAFGAATYSASVANTLDMAALLKGEALAWVVSDPALAVIDQAGVLSALKPGAVTVSAYSFSGVAECSVRIHFVALEGLALMKKTLSMEVGNEAPLAVQFTPADTSDRQLRYISSDPAIVTVSDAGVLRALCVGEVRITVSDAAGRYSDEMRVDVSPAAPKYRALLISQQNYPASVNTSRNGSDTSVSAVSSLLGTVNFATAGYETKLAEDLSRAELIAEIRNTFAAAAEQDVSLVYITCHGYYANGMSFMVLTDGSTLSARDLERELRRIPGDIVLLLDCCGSGGAIGAISDTAAFANGLTAPFADAAFAGSKYRVICSTTLDQDSYRIAFDQNADAGVMSTVFARALCDGAGWNIDAGTRGTMSADADYNGQITLAELERYLAGRVKWYLRIASSITGESYPQSVSVCPSGDPFVLFAR